MSYDRRLFFQLLHSARRVKNILGWTYLARRAYLLGMMRTMMENYEDYQIAENMRDYWRNQRSGAE